jgi:bifunctional lysine-specific demethylase and histidyl-hydroxylase NO66
MLFDELLWPISPEEFRSNYFGKKPLHIPFQEGSGRRDLFSWSRFNDLLGVLPHWTEHNLKLILNSRPIDPSFYLEQVETLGGRVRRANPAKLDVFLAMGVSLVANSVEEIAPEARRVAEALSTRFSAKVGVNAYCSFGGVQAFASHCDLHEVFALHCEGEKTWNIYENRAESPIEHVESEDAQRIIDAAKGRVMLQVRMRPGDLLYIPRGFFHDAIASSKESLHLTFSVSPLYGRAIFHLLEEVAMSDPVFREYLPDARDDDGDKLKKHLAFLSDKIVRLLESKDFEIRLANRQRQICSRDHEFSLPLRQRLEFFARNGNRLAISDTHEGPVLTHGSQEMRLGRLGEAARWIFSRPAFSLQELFANFQSIPQVELRALVEKLQDQNLLSPYQPELM